ncbi:MAG TPA: hypothetical protein PLA87_03705 [Pseudomonadota bacterium]|jgi:hypothetical protein|nr:hypothetical protein [Pseudomonadota bacterium]
MRRILLVEGSDSRPPGAEESVLSKLWGTICESLGVPRFDRVLPIHKGFIENLTEGYGALDEEIVRFGLSQPEDALVVVWDARPPWVGVTKKPCQWAETLGLYQHLDDRQRLPEVFRAHVRGRRDDLEGRSQPKSKQSPPVRLVPGSLYAVCIDPMFEDLFCDEDVVRKALGLANQNAGRDWPRKWQKHNQLEAKALLDKAITAARKHRPQPDIVRQIRLSYTTNQESWAAHFIRYFAQHAPDKFGEHPVVKRLRTLLAK